MRSCRIEMRWTAAILCMALGFAASGDSLFTQRVADRGTFISDLKARYKVGDIITVMVRETIDATTSANTNTKKESTVEAEANAADNPFLVSSEGLINIKPEELPVWSIEAENEARTQGTTTRTNRLVMTVTCMVIQVFSNGNVMLDGTRSITVNREDSKIRISGIVRSRDITAQNTIQSNQMASAKIELLGKGPLWNNQRRGFFTKLLDWFSPF